MPKKTIISEILRRIDLRDDQWTTELSDNKKKIEAAIEIGLSSDPEEIINVLISTEEGEKELKAMLQSVDNISSTKTRVTPDRIKGINGFKEIMLQMNQQQTDQPKEAMDAIEDINDETDDLFTDPIRPEKIKRKREEAVKISDTIRIEDDSTPNDEKKRKIGKIPTWKIDDCEVPLGWYKIDNSESKPIIIIRSKETNKEDIKKTITEKWMELPAEDGIIAAIFTGVDNCKVETLDDYNRTIIYNKLTKEHPDWDISYPKLKQPKLRLTNVIKPDYIDWDKWTELVKKKNKWEDSHLQIIDYQKIYEDKYLVTIEVEGKIRSKIEDKKGMVAGPIGTYEAFDILPIQRCINCLSYSHWTKECVVQEFCLRCSKNHKTPLCPRKEEKQIWFCGGCYKRGHSFLSRKCPRFRKAILVATRQINYTYGWIMAPLPSVEEGS